MADPPLPQPDPQPQPQPEPAPQPQPEPKPDPAPQPEPQARPQPQPDWRDDRIGKLTAQLHETRRALEIAQAAGKQPGSTMAPTPGTVTLTEAELNQRVEQGAAARSAQQEFLRLCNETAAQGRKDFQDFDLKIQDLRRIFDPNDVASATAYNTMVLAAIRTGSGPKVIYELSRDLSNATRVMNLSPVEMGIEMARMAQGEVRGSSAPAPITTVGNRQLQHTGIAPDDPERGHMLGTAEWMKRRGEQVADLRKDGTRIQ